jgi:hypothetical protein
MLVPTSASEVVSIAVDATNLYWTAVPSVMKLPLAGGAATSLGPMTGNCQLAVDATTVYWVDATAVHQVPIAGGSPLTLAQNPYPPGIAINATTVFFGHMITSSGGGGVAAVPKGGGTITLLASDFPTSIAVDATNVYFTHLPNQTGNEVGGAVGEVPVGGGTPTFIAPPSSLTNAGTRAVAVDATSVYWLTQAPLPQGNTTPTGALIQAPLAGGPSVILATDVAPHSSIVVDATSVYYARPSGIARIPLAGGAESIVAAGSPDGAFAIDAMNVYWAVDGGIAKSPK